MQVEVRVFGGLEKFIPGASFGQSIPVECPGGSTAGQLVDTLGIPGSMTYSPHSWRTSFLLL
ncbi:MAG TPA: hypothetical protein GXX25_13450 [Desulfotomaculum sp.]|nr:hypothetical protein [Desulfotomaculum sp.]